MATLLLGAPTHHVESDYAETSASGGSHRRSFGWQSQLKPSSARGRPVSEGAPGSGSSGHGGALSELLTYRALEHNHMGAVSCHQVLGWFGSNT